MKSLNQSNHTVASLNKAMFDYINDVIKPITFTATMFNGQCYYEMSCGEEFAFPTLDDPDDEIFEDGLTHDVLKKILLGTFEGQQYYYLCDFDNEDMTEEEADLFADFYELAKDEVELKTKKSKSKSTKAHQ